MSADTIVAAATPPGTGGIGIVRLSGDGVERIARDMLGSLPEPRMATHRHFRNASGERVDTGLALYFPAPASFTGESVLELHGHGGPVVVGMVVDAAVELGARPAEPGEFSRRAFLNGNRSGEHREWAVSACSWIVSLPAAAVPGDGTGSRPLKILRR